MLIIILISFFGVMLGALSIIFGIVFLINENSKDHGLMGFSWLLLGSFLLTTSIYSISQANRANENDILDHDAHYVSEQVIKGSDTITLYRIEFNEVRP